MPANDSARRMPWTLFAAGALLTIVCAVAAAFESANPITPRHYVAWQELDAARRIATESNRPILIAVVSEGGRESAMLEQELFATPEVAKRIARDFVPVRIVDCNNRGRRNAPGVDALLTQFRVETRPALVVTSADGERYESLYRHRGAARAEAFLASAAAIVRKPKAPKEDAEGMAYVAALSRIGSSGMPSFSPDGKRIAYVSDLSGTSQVWIVDVDGGYPQLVTTLPDGVGAALWSPSGEWIAVASGHATQIYVVHPDGTGLRRLTGGTHERNVMGWWTADDRIAVATIRRTASGMESALIDPRHGRATVVAAGLIIDVADSRALVVRRDGAKRTLAVIRCGTDNLVGPDRQVWDRQSCRSGPAIAEDAFGRFVGDEIIAATSEGRDRTALVSIGRRVLWARDDADVASFAVDGRRAAVVWSRDGVHELALLDLASGTRESVQLPLDHLGEPVFSPDGRTLAFSGSSARMPADVWLLDLATKQTRRVTRSPHPGVDLDKLVEPELVRFRGADGLPLSGWLYRGLDCGGPSRRFPSGSDAAEARAAAPLPHSKLVISLHGGPAQQETPTLAPTYQALVARGISVFAPNIRGSAGFGKRFLTLDDGALREHAIADVKAAADFVVARGLADPRRLGIMGESYGGWLTVTMLARYPRLFAAAVDQYGPIDLERDIRDEAPVVAEMLRAEYGDDPALLRDLSPIHRLDDIATPTLVLHGARDPVVSPWHSDRLVRSLRRRRIATDYLVFPDEGHGWRKPENRVRAAVAVTKWFSRYLSSAVGP